MAEVYPSLWRRRYARGDRTTDEQDAYATSLWLSEMDQHGELVDRYVSPPLCEEDSRIARSEGWILGVT